MNTPTERFTALEELAVAKRPALTNYNIEVMPTGDGEVMRITTTEGVPVSPMFFSEPCLQAYLQRMPLLTHEEWENHPITKESND